MMQGKDIIPELGVSGPPELGGCGALPELPSPDDVPASGSAPVVPVFGSKDLP
jgi:hypothetical protein